jgi:hypothetical protein
VDPKFETLRNRDNCSERYAPTEEKLMTTASRVASLDMKLPRRRYVQHAKRVTTMKVCMSRIVSGNIHRVV